MFHYATDTSASIRDTTSSSFTSFVFYSPTPPENLLLEAATCTVMILGSTVLVANTNRELNDPTEIGEYGEHKQLQPLPFLPPPPHHLLIGYVLRSLLCPLLHKSTSHASLGPMQSLPAGVSPYSTHSNISEGSSLSVSSISTRSSMSSSITTETDSRYSSIVQRLSKTISTRNLRASVTLADLTPPTLPLSRPPTEEIVQCCGRIQAIFDIHEQAFQNMVDSILEVYEPDTVARDLEVCSLLLGVHLSHLQPDDFQKQAEYEAWRSGELIALDKLTRIYSTGGLPAPLPMTTGSPNGEKVATLLLLKINEAKGLIPKDKLSGSNNPYCVIEFQGRVFVSPVHKKTVNPRWDFEVPLMILDSSSHVVVSIWNQSTVDDKARYTQINGTKDAFLGVCMIPLGNIIKLAQSGDCKTQKIDLGKRTSKSRVSGSITITVELAYTGPAYLPPNYEVQSRAHMGLSERIYRAIPSDANRYYYELYRLVVEFDITTLGCKRISDLALTILHDIAGSWRIRPLFRTICAYDILCKLYSSGYISAEILYRQGFSKAFHDVVRGSNAITKAEFYIFQSSSETLSSLLEFQLCTFFNTIKTTSGVADTQSRKSKHQLEMMTIMISAIRTCTLIPGAVENIEVSEYASQLLLQSLNARYHGLLGISNICQDSTEILPLTLLIESILSELQVYTESYDIVLFDSVHIPSLAAQALYGSVVSQLEEFSKTYVAESPDMSDVFDLYSSTRRLQAVCETLNVRTTDQFPVSKWFRPFLRDWLLRLETNVFEWIKSSLSIDKFTRLSEVTLHSTSVIDIFTSFQQQIDFVNGLDWPNGAELQIFYAQMLQSFFEGILRYMSITIEKLLKVLCELKDHQAIKRQTFNSPIGKIKIHLKVPNFINNKTTIDQGVHYHFSPEACVLLCNMTSLYPRFLELLNSIPRPYCEISPSSLHFNSPERLFYGAPRYAVRIEVVRGHRLVPTRPWTTQLSCRITSSTGRVLGCTKRILQSSNAAWSEMVYSLMTESEIVEGLHFCVLHHVPGKAESQYAVGKAVIDNISSVMNTEGGLETLVQLGSYGRLLVRISISVPEDIVFLSTLVDLRIKSSVEQCIESFVDQLCSDIYNRVYSISLKYKTQAFTAFIQKSKPKFSKSWENGNISHGLINMDELGTDLEPLFEYLNANMEVVTENVEETLAFHIIGRIWDRILTGFESMIVPSLGDEWKDQKPWDERRMCFFKKLVESTELFFRSGGEGLPDDYIHTQAYRQLQFIIASYDHPQHILIETYNQYLHTDPTDSVGDSYVNHTNDLSKESQDIPQPVVHGSSLTSLESTTQYPQTDLDWILKLMKMRGGKEIVDNKLQERVS
ncbi:hypothetical protein BASA84_000559 [Batrachochytrium salamandrivorans]|nr:hypothetical protein BASA84_000559 [Batrachochytrium salamandrivorans]